MKLILCITFLLVSICQNNEKIIYPRPTKKEFVRVEWYVKGVKYENDLKKLAKDLTYKFENPYLKLRAIYAWIAFNIAYDFENMDKPSKLAIQPQEVIKAGKTVCSGYANLMTTLCNNIGLECETISGWSKTTIDDLLDIGSPDHAWNGIRINDKWIYCDATWGAGYSMIGEKKFIRHYTSAYYGMSVEKICLEHYPTNSKWQNEYSITKDQFDNFPLYHRLYFTYWMKNLNQKSKKLKGILKWSMLSFETNFKINSIRVEGTKKSLPFMKFGDKYLIYSKRHKKNSTITLYVNQKGVVTYYNP